MTSPDTYHRADPLANHLNDLCDHCLVVDNVGTDSDKRKGNLAPQLIGDPKDLGKNDDRKATPTSAYMVLGSSLVTNSRGH